jgi:hypothetical protein
MGVGLMKKGEPMVGRGPTLLLGVIWYEASDDGAWHSRLGNWVN